jgi:hypothetical protein
VGGGDGDAEEGGRYREQAAAVSAEKPPTGLRAVIRWPRVLTIRQPPESVPSEIAE